MLKFPADLFEGTTPKWVTQMSGTYNLSAIVSGIIFPIAFDHFVDAGVSVSQSEKCVSLSRGDISHGNHIKMLSVHNLLFISIYIHIWQAE